MGTLKMLDRPYGRAAAVYRARGWLGVLPMPKGEDSKKYPPKGFTGHDGGWPDSDDIGLWRATRGYHNVAIRLPRNVIGIDVDAYEPKTGGKTLAKMTGQLGPWTGPDQPQPVRSTSRDDGVSGIYLFRAQLPDAHKWCGSLGNDVEVVHFGHRYVMAAPSRHPKSGRLYRWLDSANNKTKLPRPEQLPLLSDAWVNALIKPIHLDEVPPEGRQQPRYASGAEGSPYGLSALSREIEALRAEWDRGEGGFNNQLNTSAFSVGRLVGGGELSESTAKQALLDALAELGAPSDQYKTLDSGFTDGLAQPRSRTPQPIPKPPPPTNNPNTVIEQPADTPAHVPRSVQQAGSLIGTGSTIDIEKPEIDPIDKQTKLVRSQWSDFDMRATGRIVDEDLRLQAYSVLVTRDRDGAKFDTILPVRILTDPRKLGTWLSHYEVTVLLTSVTSPAWNSRLGLYLASHRAPVARIARHLGWDDDAESFICFDGAITADGLHPFDAVRPDPDLRRRSVRFNYGFESDELTARSVLREVLTFHDPVVCSVFGAWWAACLLKGQIMRRVSLFPAMGIEAPSESGKTSGFFPMMVALAGNQRGHSNDTVAAFRDLVAGHRNGIAWQDDLDDPKRMFELIRAATAEGTLGKKAEDNDSSFDAQLVAPIMVSGEGLSVAGQKAMADRMVLLYAPSPKDRVSLRDPSKKQWDDIVELRDRWPDLTELAGHMVVMALRNAHLVDRITDLRIGSGRHGDKMGVLRMGARVLAEMTGDASHVRVVDDWAASVIDTGAENVFTMQMVPEYLRLVGARDTPRRYDLSPYHAIPFPVLIRNDNAGRAAVWVNTDLLAQWWSKEHRGKVEDRTQTAEALRQQATALGMRGVHAGTGGIDYVRLRVYEGAAEAANRNERRTWQRLPDFISDRLLEEFEEHDPTQDVGVTQLNTAERVARARQRGQRRA